MRWRRLAIWLVAPAIASVVALAVSSVALLLSGNSPATAFSSMLSYGSRLSTMISVVDAAIPYYLAGLAVGIGFKMNLFNIGVEGQYRMAALIAAAVGGAVAFPAVLEIPLIILTAMAVGAAWASIPAVLKVTRGVHEVISSIMLNSIATGLGAYLLSNYLRQENAPGDLIIKTPAIPKSGWFPSLNGALRGLGFTIPPGADLHGFVIVAVLVGVAYYVLIWRTRYGYDLRASGINPLAARASGVHPNRMVMQTMLLSGAIAGLIGMSQVMGYFHRYTLDFPAGLGFTGIAIALFGRNHPVGIAIGAWLFAFMDKSAQILDLRGIPKEIVVIMQGVIILSAVVAYEVVRRYAEAQERRSAAAQVEDRETGEPPPPAEQRPPAPVTTPPADRAAAPVARSITSPDPRGHGHGRLAT